MAEEDARQERDAYKARVNELESEVYVLEHALGREIEWHKEAIKRLERRGI